MEFVGECGLWKDRILSPDGSRVIWVHFKFVPWTAPLLYSTIVWGRRMLLHDLGFFGSLPSFLLLICGSQREHLMEASASPARNANSLASFQISWVRYHGNGPSNMCYAKPFRWFWQMLMLEIHCPWFLFLHMFSLPLLSQFR